MSIYKSKPIEVEAFQLTEENSKNMFRVGTLPGIDMGEPVYWVSNNDGSFKVRYGDWVVKFSDGQYVTMKQEMFDRLFGV
jgi:hypothetical protein